MDNKQTNLFCRKCEGTAGPESAKTFFASFEELEVHLASVVHYNIWPYECMLCENGRFSTRTAKQMMNHYKEAHNTKVYTFLCSLTPETMGMKREMREHLFPQPQQTTFVCFKCSEMSGSGAFGSGGVQTHEFTDVDSLENHLVETHFFCDSYECGGCNAKFTTEKRVMRHLGEAASHGYKFRIRIWPQVLTCHAAIQRCLQNAFRNEASESQSAEEPPTKRARLAEGLVLRENDENQCSLPPMKIQKWLEDVKHLIYYTLEDCELPDKKVVTLPICVTVCGRKHAVTFAHLEHSGWEKKKEVLIYSAKQAEISGQQTGIRCRVVSIHKERTDCIILERMDDSVFCDEPILKKARMGEEYILCGYHHVSGEAFDSQLTARYGTISHAARDCFGGITGTALSLPGYSGGGCFSEDNKLLGMSVGTYHSHSLGRILSSESIGGFIEELQGKMPVWVQPIGASSQTTESH